MKIKMTWFRIMMLISFLLLSVFFINMGFTDYSAGILVYNGFIPQPWEFALPFGWLILCLISLGAELEYGIERRKTL